MSTVEIAVVVGGQWSGAEEGTEGWLKGAGCFADLGCGDVECGVVMGEGEGGKVEGKGGAGIDDMLLRLSIKERMEALQAKRDMREERRRRAEIETEERRRRARSQAMDDLLKGVEVLEELGLCDIPDQEFVREMERKVKEAMRGWCARLGDVDPSDLKC